VKGIAILVRRSSGVLVEYPEQDGHIASVWGEGLSLWEGMGEGLYMT